MKNTTLFIAALFMLCVTNVFAQESNADIVRSFLNNIPAAATANISTKTPVASLQDFITKNSVKAIILEKGNMQEALNSGKQFTSGIIVVGEHTFVKITDFTKCTVSASWSACVPFGEGIIKKGQLIHTSGPINNIIGRPDTQGRTLYLFH